MFAANIDANPTGSMRDMVSGPFRVVFDRYIPFWRQDNFSLRYALSFPDKSCGCPHACKKRLMDFVTGKRTRHGESILTIVLPAAAAYNGDLLFQDMERLKAIPTQSQIQISNRGKAHPRDDEGKELIKRILGQAGIATRDMLSTGKLQYDAGGHDHIRGRSLA
jgi:hypothetical protein